MKNTASVVVVLLVLAVVGFYGPGFDTGGGSPMINIFYGPRWYLLGGAVVAFVLGAAPWRTGRED